MPTNQEITRHHDPDPDEDPWVEGPALGQTIEIVRYDSSWPDRYAWFAGTIRKAMGDSDIDLAHIGSTSVPGLAAKDVIDIDMTVVDPRDEHSYIPALTAAGWRLIVREPSWHEHRCLRHDAPRANLHVFGPDCPEVIRHAMFRDWLRTHPNDRQIYEDAKRAAGPASADVMDYNSRKQTVIREIYDRLFRSAGLLPPTSLPPAPDSAEA